MHALRGGSHIRTVYAMLDNDWVFFEKGDPLPFEEVAHYRARRKRDRLNVDIVSSYIARSGYGSLCSAFWIDATAPAQLLGTRDFRVWSAGSL